MADQQLVLRSTETDDDGKDDVHVDEGPVPRSETDAEQVVIPTPPFGPEDWPLAPGQKVKCFWEGCKREYAGYDVLLSHIKRDHGVKKIPPEWQGTWFLKFANKDRTGQQKERRLANPKPKPTPKNAAREGAVVKAAAAKASALTSIAHGEAESMHGVTTIAQGAQQLIHLPGSSTPLVIPAETFSELVSIGFLQVTAAGTFEWMRFEYAKFFCRAAEHHYQCTHARRASDRASDRASGRAYERAIERASDRASERSNERVSNRANE